LLIYVLFAVWGVLPPGTSGAILILPTQSQSAVTPAKSDPDLYREVIAELQLGHVYYPSVAELHRARSYPLRPFVTVRLPTLAWLSAALGEFPTFAVFCGLIAACAWLWCRRLQSSFTHPRLKTTVLAVVCLALLVTANPVSALFHDAWAGTLIAIGLALWQPERIWPSLAAIFCAALFREMAGCVLILMMALAAYERRWREMALWGAALVCFALVMTAHAMAVAAVVRPDDLQSQGWTGLGGWPLVISTVMSTSSLVLVPRWLAAVLVPAMFIGWLSWRDPVGLRVVGVIAGFSLAIALFARPETYYWGLLFAPLLLPGLLFVPAVARDVVRGISGRSAVP
jgi:hypothetical protein